MPKSQTKPNRAPDLLAPELLKLYDDITALNAYTAFVLEALIEALVRGDGADRRSSEGATFCAQWLRDRTIEIELHLKEICRKAYTARRRH